MTIFTEEGQSKVILKRKVHEIKPLIQSEAFMVRRLVQQGMIAYTRNLLDGFQKVGNHDEVFRRWEPR